MTATILEFPAPPRELHHRAHWAEPPRTDADGHFEWALEQHLAGMWRAAVSPYTVLDAFAPQVAEHARPLLDDLFTAADQVASIVAGERPGELTPACAHYADVLYDLARTLRGAR